jgi:1-acyl-sn-glycerol-3-phosphate acyltransferase
MKESYQKYPYPRRYLIRKACQKLAHLAFAVLTNLCITGKENLPDGGPLLVVANHFSFVDPAAMIRAVPWLIEFVGGFQMPNAPPVVRWLPKVWGYYPVHRGSVSTDALRAAEAILEQNGVLGIFPEAGNWATVLRPGRPGAAFLAVRTGAPILPMGFANLNEIFPSLREGRRARISIRIGRRFGPFQAEGRGRERRPKLDAIGHEIMKHIAQLIPPEKRGYYSEDPAIRAAAKGTEIYPWDENPEA